MAGGRGTRMRSIGEKLALGSKPLVTRVVDAMVDSTLYSSVIAATSHNSPRAQSILEDDPRVKIKKTSGGGYVNDMRDALCSLEGEVMIVPGDLALLDGEILRDASSLRADPSAWTVIMATARFAKSLGANPSFVTNVEGMQCCYTGVSIVDASLAHAQNSVSEEFHILDDRRIALNVNTPDDYASAFESVTNP